MPVKETNKKLELYGFQSIIDPGLKVSSYLVETFKFFQNIEAQKLEAIRLYKNSKFNVKSVSEFINVERQTIYNHPLLHQFIKSLQQEIRDKDVFNALNTQAQKLEEKESEINLFYKRDVQIEELKIQIDSLKEQLLGKEIEYNNLELEYQSKCLNNNKNSKILSMNKYLEDE